MENNNLELWHKVEKTNPKYTKQANVGGNKITSIAPQYQIMNVTEQFGSYGKSWGFKNIELDYTLASEFNLIVFKGTFFYTDGEFPIINSIKMFMDNAKTKIDDNFAKKLETDALTKAISKLGFNADIFMGKFDDTRYLAEVTKEFAEQPQAPKPIKLSDKAIDDLVAKGFEEVEKYVELHKQNKVSLTDIQLEKLTLFLSEKPTTV
jgi:hypothetical protein